MSLTAEHRPMERPVQHRRGRRPARAGFTLIELLVAILIIAALLAILLPAVAGAFRRAKEAQVSAEINNMATALASFKNTYGDFPPSRVILSEEGFNVTLARTEFTTATMIPGADGTDSDMTYAQLAQRSMSYLKRFWPRVDFMSSPGNQPNPGEFNDFNGDRSPIDPATQKGYYIINGSECLAFFLGGIPIYDGNTVIGVSGFSRSPKYPFVDNGRITKTVNGVTTTVVLAPNRTVPNYEFNNGRLIDMDGDGIPSYIDPFDVTVGNRRAYAYFSAYGTNAYDPNDVNGYGHNVSDNFELEDDGSTVVERGFSVSYPTSPVISPSPNPYTSGVPQSTTGLQAWINANSFQLFSAGQDRQFGLGGTYKANATGGDGVLPILSATGTPGDPGNIHNDDTSGVRNRENDNVTNFSGGRIQ